MFKPPSGPPSAADPRHPPAGKGFVSPKVGVMGLFICFAMVLAAFLGLGLFDSASDSDASKDPTEAPGQLPPAERINDEAIAALLPEDARHKIETELAAWFADPARAAIADDQAVDETEWVERLLTPSLWRRIQRLPPRIYEPLANVPDALSNPAGVRGRLVRVWGKVDTIRQDTLKVEGGPRPCWILELRDQNGVPWTLTGLDQPSDDIEGGVWVKGYCMFAKTWPTDSGSPALHGFLTRRVIPSYPPVKHLAPKTEWASEVIDGTMHAADPRSALIEDRPFYGMLNYVRSMGPAGFRQARDTERLEIVDRTDTKAARPLIELPLNYRFRAVRLRLAISHESFATEHVNDENPGNIEAVYGGYTQDDQGNIIYVVSPFPRDTFDFRDARLVEVEGFFYKARRVEARNGRRYWMPIIIAASIEPITWDKQEADPKTVVAMVLIGLVGLLAMFVLLLFRNRKERQAFEERHAARMSSRAAQRQ